MYNGTKVIDVHGHLTAPPEFAMYSMALMLQRRRASNIGLLAHTGIALGEELQIPDEKMEPGIQYHLGLMDDRNIDIQLISPRPVHMWHWETPYVQSVWCATTNNTIAQMVRLHPDRFAGVGQLPQSKDSNTSNCLEEFERCVKELGFVGAIVNPDPGADGDIPGMNDEYWYPLYEKAQELDVPLMIHPSFSRDPRWDIVPMNYQVNNVIFEFLATITLESSRVFLDFPRLKVHVSHFGGALNRFLMNDESHYFGNKDMGDNLTFDTCAHDVEFIKAAIHQKGVHRTLFGTEAPGAGSHGRRPDDDPLAPGRPGDDLVPIIGGLDTLSEEDKINIFNKNPLRIYSKLKI